MLSYIDRRVGTEHAETTGAIMAAGLIVGLGFGSGLSFAVVAIL